MMFGSRLPLQRRRTRALLERMDEFMGDEALALVGVGPVVAGSKDHILADGVGLGAHRTGSSGCRGARVNTNRTEVLLEARLHKGSCGWVERPARGA
jgi:hypothetical protein